MSKFQVALLVLFGFFILAAVLVFAFYKGGSSSNNATVTAWGSVPAVEFNKILSDSSFSGNELIIHYVEKDASSLQGDFTEALARGNGPDLLIITQEDLWRAKAKLTPFAEASVSRRAFSDTFAEGGEAFLLQDGAYALPLATDPLVLYYNRDLLTSASIAKPFAYWDEVYEQAKKLTARDAAGNITQSAIALGETRNIADFKGILSLLFLQAGTPITSFVNGGLRSLLADNAGLPISPSESALDFYTQFANPSKPFYSWNRVEPDAQTAFASGDLAYYVGFASELPAIRKKSPTLNFAVATVPQSRVAGKTLTFGRTYAVAVSRGTKNYAASATAALKLASAKGGALFAAATGLAPARRDLLSTKPAGASESVFYDAALQAKSWLDPDAGATASAFAEAVEAVTSGRARVSEAVRAASDKIDKAIKN